ncbi:protein KINESIN LIGHT CHAIN-RELATED 2-like isoform X2 [Andrographis paniculata]|uniref:protein KINESIN LIGHT CHAIN-RELATED 2-like isoform X2 n=1 Tax=Andrographis paniculata TaxID=175694 RepID=UPI0021E842BC|nr:protein KINESIN LIGHT CHAIN-RELATED 2-like isoform X2 [Andrographis paniculata]
MNINNLIQWKNQILEDYNQDCQLFVRSFCIETKSINSLQCLYMDRHKTMKANPPDTRVDSTPVFSMPDCSVNGVFAKGSPRSPLISTGNASFSVVSPESDLFDLILDGAINDTSIEQMCLYRNVYEMESSDQSPSRCSSFISYGHESFIDSELRFLAQGRAVTEEETSKLVEVSDPGLESKCVQKAVQDTSSRKKEKRMKCRNGDNDYLGPYLLKQARDTMVSGNNTRKALELAIRAMKSFESCVGAESRLRLVMCLHVVAALHCRLGEYDEAILFLERSIEIPAMELGSNDALAKFAGCMQLGDTYASLGLIGKSIEHYTNGLAIQRQVLGEKDVRFGDTCRYLAEAYLQAFQFDEAERLCAVALEIHKTGSKEVEDRQLMGLILDTKGDYEGALEHYLLVRNGTAGDGSNASKVSMDCSIGDAYASLKRYDEAAVEYRKALKTVRSSRGDDGRLSVAFVFVRLADLCCRMGNFVESKMHCANALRVYVKRMSKMRPDDVADGLVEVSGVYVSMGEIDEAIRVLKRAVNVYGNAPGRTCIVGGIEAQTGVLYYIAKNYVDSYKYLKKATTKFKLIGETKTVLYGIVLNQMGMACLRLDMIEEAKDSLEEARSVLERECGSYHADKLGVYGNLSGTYDAMGRIDDAIELLEHAVETREKRLGKGNQSMEEEKNRLAVLLKESRGIGKTRR